MLNGLFKRKKGDEAERSPPEYPQDEAERAASSEVVQVPAEKPDAQTMSSSDEPEGKEGWFSRLKAGLSKTRNSFMGQIASLLRVGRTIDEELMEEIEEVLIQADVGIDTAMTLMDNVREMVKAEGLSDSAELGDIIKQEICNVLGDDQPLHVNGPCPYTILVLGVNGAGKRPRLESSPTASNLTGSVS